MDPGWVTVALLGKPRGNRGEVTAITLSSNPHRFAELSHVFLFGSGTRVQVESTWFHLGTLVFKFAGIDSISDAEALTGAEVRIPFSERRPLDPGEYYHSDLIGCKVHDRASGALIGMVTGFEDGGSSGLLQVGPTLLIPFTKAICVSIRPESREILVDLPEGLLELNQ